MTTWCSLAAQHFKIPVSPLLTWSLKLYCAAVRVMDCDGKRAISTIVIALEWVYDNMVQPAVGHFKHVCHFF